MSLLESVRSIRGEGTATQSSTTPNTGSSGSLLESVQISRGEIQPATTQPTVPKKNSFSISSVISQTKSIAQKAPSFLSTFDIKKTAQAFKQGAKLIPSQLETAGGILIQGWVENNKFVANFFNKNKVSGKVARQISPTILKPALAGLDFLQNNKKASAVTKKVAEQITTQGTKQRESGFQKQQALQAEYSKDRPEATGVQKYAEMVALNLPQMATTLALTTATAVLTRDPRLAAAVGLSSSFGMGANEVYTQARDFGISDKEALPLAQVGGAIIGAIDLIPFGKYVGDIIEGSGAVDTVKKSFIKKVGTQILSTGIQGGLEGITEGIQEIIGNALEQTYNDNVDLFTGTKEAFITAVLSGGLLDVTVSGVMSLSKKATPEAVVSEVETSIESALTTDPQERTPEQQQVVETLITQELTPDQALSYVLENNIEKTDEGKQLVKMAAEAKLSNQSILVEPDSTETGIQASIVAPGTLAQRRSEEVDGNDTDVTTIAKRQIVVDGDTVDIQRAQKEEILEENRIIHAGKSPFTEVQKRGVITSKNGIFGEGVYFGEEKSKLDWGTGGTDVTYEVDKSKFNFIDLPTTEAQNQFLIDQGFEPKIKNVAAAVIKSGKYDGAIISNEDTTDIGNTYVITNTEKLNQEIAATDSVLKKPIDEKPSAEKTEESQTTKEVKVQSLSEYYAEQDQEAIGQAWYEVMAELEIAQAGQRIFTEEGVSGTPSTFPDWIPEELRRSDLFQSVLGGISDPTNLEYPPNSQPRKQALYEQILSEVDSRAGTDSSSIIEALKAQNETKKSNTQATSDRSAGRRKASKRTEARGEKTDNLEEKITEYIDKRGAVKFRDLSGAEDDRNLIAQHNIKPEGVLHADKMGGLPLPSIAISRKEYPLEGFGEITLIAESGLYDPALRDNKVFNADAYTPRYPSVTYQTDSKKVKAALTPIIEDVEGYYKDSHFSPRYLESTYSKTDAMLESRDFEGNGRRALEDDFLLQGYFAKQKGATPDTDITQVREIIEKNSNEYQEFIDTLFEEIDPVEKLFKGFTYSGSRKYQTHTLENVVKTMKSEMKSGEGFLYGIGTVRSKVAQKYTTLNQIKKDRNKITSSKNIQKIKSEFDDRWSDFIEKGTGGFSVGDSRSFTEAVIDGIKRKNIEAELKAYGYNTDIVPDLVQFLNEIKDAPSEYFEVKVQRAVDLNEFTGALVPNDTDKRVIDVLKKNGLKIVTYNPETETRSQKIEENFKREMFRVKDDVKRFTGKTITDAQESEIINLNKKIFGDDNVKITLQIMANRQALGSSRDGMITIVDGQAEPKDTFYHEAVHKFIDVFTTRDEQIELFKAGIEKYDTTNLSQVEERIAEDFIAYAKSREGFVGSLKKIIDRILARIKAYLGNVDAIESLYQKILTDASKKPTTTEPSTADIPRKDGFSRFQERLEEQLLDSNGQKYNWDDTKRTYDKISLEEDAEKAATLLKKSPERAMRIARGFEDPKPGDPTLFDVMNAVAIKAFDEGNAALGTEMINKVSLTATRYGQNIATLRGNFNSNSPQSFIKQIIDNRLEALGKTRLTEVDKMIGRKKTAKTRATAKVDIEVEKLKKRVQKEMKLKQDKIALAQSIIDSLKCK